jgi:hypothetical protein
MTQLKCKQPDCPGGIELTTTSRWKITDQLFPEIYSVANAEDSEDVDIRCTKCGKSVPESTRKQIAQLLHVQAHYYMERQVENEDGDA